MPETEGRPPYKPEARAGEERPKRIALTKEKYAEGTLGYILFPAQLEGRSRPETVFDKDLDEILLLQRGSIVIKRLADRNIRTAADILNLPETNLASFTPQKGLQGKIKGGLQNYMNRLIIPPQGRLIEAFSGQKQYPIPIEREKELIDFVNDKVNELEYDVYKNFLRDRFGLDDGIYKTIPQISRLYHGRDRARSLENRIRHHHIVNDLYGYNTTPEESVARGAFDAVFYKELPRELHDRTIDLSGIRESAREELPKIHRVFRINGKQSSDNVIDVSELLKIDLRDARMPEEAQVEISKNVKDYYNLYFGKPTT